MLTNTPQADPVEVALKAFQVGVDAWMDVCFGAAIKADMQERCDRFVEESLEFVQAAGYSPERAHALVDYTFNRPVGEVNQEVGGVMVTLAAMCNTLGVDIGAAAETELSRVWTKVEQIRAKQAAKPTGSALPVPRNTRTIPPTAASSELVERCRKLAMDLCGSPLEEAAPVCLILGENADTIEALTAHITTLETRLSHMTEAAGKMVAKLDECQPYIDNAFAIQWARSGVHYSGPHYGEELAALRTALQAYEASHAD